MTAGTEAPVPGAALIRASAPGSPRPAKLATQVARRIESDIVAAGWPVGTVLGSEADLRARYGVSRAVLREAVRLVEHHDVATMRRGPSGGLVVQAPDARSLTTAVVIYLEYVGTTVEDLLGVRLLLEPLASRLAARRMTEDHIVALRETLAAERTHGDLAAGRRDLLHTAIGRLSGNPALRLFVDVLVQLTGRYARIPAPPGAPEAEVLTRAADRAHDAIVDSIIAGDVVRAEHRTVAHLEAMRAWLLSANQRPIARSVDGPGEPPAKQKLAETIARRMMTDIATSGLAVGEVFGSEADLLARFDVSRAVFREAVRLLEYHSVARMRRGPGGGLIVSEPDPTASIEAMAIYLDYEQIGAADLRSVRDVIEIGSLVLATARHADPEVAERLRAAHRVRPDTPWAELNELSHLLHTEIAELSGNPILALFLRIITTVWARHSAQPGTVEDDAAAAAAVSHVHGRIVEAVLAGDLPLARHRMHRHLEALDAWWQ